MANGNKDQLMKVAKSCSQYNFEEDSSLRSDVSIMGETAKSCENCVHFTAEHKCDIDLIDKILTNMAMELDDEY
ncbi:hypothetical protein [Sporosalibacterium faouarense]|uniref:hypothetical protein n=1 Tax=Sporosalibacterium faouarense TaxID=516123 RepID=UPI00141C8748|nr:hypothetical protein [Sporosalibacterium faouarense]MTI46765.1 hypothetical protein [Bacillota bacterium]